MKTRSLAFICVGSIDFVELCFVSKANPEAPHRPSTCGLHLRMPASLPSPKDPSLIRLELTKSPQFLFWKGHISSHILRLCRARLQHTHCRGHSSVCSGYTLGKSEKQLPWVSVPKLPLRLPVPGTLTSPAIVASWVASLNSTVSESPGIATIALQALECFHSLLASMWFLPCIGNPKTASISPT